jgi:hypothetical protein
MLQHVTARKSEADTAAPIRLSLVSRGPVVPAKLAEVRTFFNWLWSVEACLVCGVTGPCIHREIEVDLARAEEWFRRLRQGGAGK